MTNEDLYDKMLYMRRLTNLNIKSIFIIVALILAFCSFTLSSVFFVSADDGDLAISTDYFLPNDNLEHRALTSPSDVYSDDTVTAIVGADKTLTVYYDGAYNVIDKFDTIKQVKKLDDQTLLVSDGGIFYSISLSNFTDKTPLQSSLSEPIGGTCFDINDDYLVTAYGKTAEVYNRINGQFVKFSDFPIDTDISIAINANDEIFFISDTGLCKCTVNDTVSDSFDGQNISTETPSKIIADNQFVYYLTQGQTGVHRVAIYGTSASLLTVGELDEDYELGKLFSPTGIAFRNNNLLITDAMLNAVQEFTVNGNVLDFTGFAIASGKTAYNRVSSNNVEIEKTNDTVAILDSDKLLIVSNNNPNPYARENFDNYLLNKDFNGVMPQAIALGEESVLLSFNHKTARSGYLKLLNTNDHTLSNDISVNELAVEDICYQSGSYYVLLTQSISMQDNKSFVYKINEGQTELTQPLFSLNDFSALTITADVFGNVYLSDVTGNVKLFPANDFSNPTSIGTRVGLKKMITDLGGILYALSADGLARYEQTEFVNLNVSLPDSQDQINSFGMNFETETVFFTVKDKEYLCATDLLGNYSLQDVEASQTEFITTKNTALVDEFKSVTVDKNANVYKVLRERNGNKFAYVERTTVNDVYAFICQTDLGDGLSISVLACQDQLVLVNTNQHSTPATVSGTSAPQTVFVTTDVNAYYFPIINKIDNEQSEYISYLNFALTDQNGAVRIKKGCSINPIKTIEFLSRDNDGIPSPICYYFANFEIDGTNYSGYIPVSFTVPVLAKDFAWAEYSVETVNKTNVYTAETLDGDPIYSLTNGQKVRVLERQDGFVKIAVSVQDGEWIEGFISADAIQNRPATAFRNIILIVIISASILSTSLFLILRKRKI